MSKIYYLVCHARELAVAIGDDAGGDVYIWSDQIPHMNNFLNLTKGETIVTLNDEDKTFDDIVDNYIILGTID